MMDKKPRNFSRRSKLTRSTSGEDEDMDVQEDCKIDSTKNSHLLYKDNGRSQQQVL